MNFTRDRIRSIGWIMVVTICAAVTAVLALRVNAVKSEVHQREKQIVSLRHEILFLETEFQTRANQQQLKSLNDVEFGYSAPRSGQYIEGERQLAALGKPRGPGAPTPIRVASNLETTPSSGAFMSMVSPIVGLADEGSEVSGPLETAGRVVKSAGAGDAERSAAENLAARLARIDLRKVADE